MKNNRPNILFLLPDQHRGDWIPGMDPTLPIHMPYLESLMGEGVTFSRTVSSSPLCAPARACLASGRRYENCGVRDNSENYPLDKPTFYQALRAAGYSVGGVGKFDLHKPAHWWGLDGFLEDLKTLGFTHAVDNAGKIDAVTSGKVTPSDPYMLALEQRGLRKYHVADMEQRGQKTHPTLLPEDLYCDNWVSDNGLRMLEAFPRDSPWFLQVNFTGPHSPFDVTVEMKKRWEHTEFPEPIAWTQGKRIQAIRQNYGAMLENIDRNIGRMLSWLREHGQLENTLIVYSSDHGDMLGDFNKFGKCQPEKGSVGIPLVISGPGVQKGLRSSALVELQDLAATFSDYAQADARAFKESVSLRPVLEGRDCQHRKVIVSALNPVSCKPDQRSWRMAEDNRWKLVLEADGRGTLFNLSTDPEEAHPAENPEAFYRMKAELLQETGPF